MKIVALAGGVGGARLVAGLAQVLSPKELTVIVNTGDDFEHLGLHISPDLDTICYTLAGLSNPQTGWGRRDDSFTVLESLSVLGGATWFRIGDKDFATHLERTRRMRDSEPLSGITRAFCRSWGVENVVIPMSDDPVRTMVMTAEFGEMPFQIYFVQRKFEPRIIGFHFQGSEKASPAPGIENAIEEAASVILCPSNPWVSIDPILSISRIRTLLTAKKVIAVSSIVQGAALKGPAAKMFLEFGIQPSPEAVADHFSSLLTGFVFDERDRSFKDQLAQKYPSVLCTNTIMDTQEARVELAQDVLNFAEAL